MQIEHSMFILHRSRRKSNPCGALAGRSPTVSATDGSTTRLSCRICRDRASEVTSPRPVGGERASAGRAHFLLRRRRLLPTPRLQEAQDRPRQSSRATRSTWRGSRRHGKPAQLEQLTQSRRHCPLPCRRHVAGILSETTQVYEDQC